MRFTVPWLPPPPTREPRDDDELPGNAVALAVLVGVLARRHGDAVSGDSLVVALAGLFDVVFADLAAPELVRVMTGAVVLSRDMGLVEMLPDGSIRATETELDPGLMAMV